MQQLQLWHKTELKDYCQHMILMVYIKTHS